MHQKQAFATKNSYFFHTEYFHYLSAGMTNMMAFPHPAGDKMTPFGVRPPPIQSHCHHTYVWANDKNESVFGKTTYFFMSIHP